MSKKKIYMGMDLRTWSEKSRESADNFLCLPFPYSDKLTDASSARAAKAIASGFFGHKI